MSSTQANYMHTCLIVSVQGNLRPGLAEGERVLPVRHEVSAIGVMQLSVHDLAGGKGEKVEGYTLEAGSWRAGCTVSSTEVELLSGFWQLFERNPPRLVTFNGRGYAMPLLRYRSMAHGLTARRYHAGDRGGYGNRYAPFLHFDVMDQLTENGASAMPSLADVQNILGVQSLDSVSAALDTASQQVENPVTTARRAAVHHVGATAIAYLALRLLTGATTKPAVDLVTQAISDQAGVALGISTV